MKIITIVLAWILVVLAINTTHAATGTVTGRLKLSNGQPFSNGQVFFFNVKSPLEKPVVGKYWRVPDSAVESDSNGEFTTSLEAGSYYIGAVKRAVAGKLGPPDNGDYFLPVHDTRSTYRIITVKSNSTTSIGLVDNIQQFNEKKVVVKGMQTIIDGRIISVDGQGVSNLYVLAYTDPTMRGRPSFVSVASDGQGRYRLLVDKGRTFYLKVRDNYSGGKPQAGRLVGVYGEYDAPTPVVTNSGSLTAGIDIQVEPFAGGGPQTDETSQ
jgi:hypothetical protein